MPISGKLLTSLSLIIGLVTVVAPLSARGDTIFLLSEGRVDVVLGGLTITNTTGSSATLTGLAVSVVNPHFAGPDPADGVTAVDLDGGTCIPLLN